MGTAAFECTSPAAQRHQNQKRVAWQAQAQSYGGPWRDFGPRGRAGPRRLWEGPGRGPGISGHVQPSWSHLGVSKGPIGIASLQAGAHPQQGSGLGRPTSKRSLGLAAGPVGHAFKWLREAALQGEPFG